MIQIVQFFWQMCLFRTSPKQLPNSIFALGTVIVCFLVIGTISTLITRTDNTFINVVSPLLITLAITSSVIFLVLKLHNTEHLFRQTWSAFLAVSCVMGIIMLPFNVLRQQTEVASLITLSDSISLICFGWWLAVSGYIFNKSSGISIVQGIAITAITYMIDIYIYVQLFHR